jgi:hypothetical protein
MVGDDGMQHANGGDHENEENRRGSYGTGQHGSLRDIWTKL